MAKKNYYFDKRPLVDAFGDVMANVLFVTAKGIQRVASKSMKQAPITEHAPPGSPPNAHRGTIKNLIRYETVSEIGKTSVAIGPIPVGGHDSGNKSAPHLLEHSGLKRIRVKREVEQRRRRFAPESRRDQNVNKYEEKRSNRPERKNRDGELYQYFYTRERWEHASESEGFQRWTAARRTKWEQKDVRILSRPFMRPAMERETTPEKLASVTKKASEYVARGSRRRNG